MENPIDTNFRANNTPPQLAAYYLPLIILKKLDNTDVRAALRNDHKLKDEKVRETMIILADLAFDFHRQVPVTSKYLLYFYLILAGVMILAGIVLTVIFWQMGYSVFAAPVIFLSGLGLLFKTNKQIGLLEEQ